MKFKFEDLFIWQKAMAFGEDLNKITYNSPKEENYNLSSQLRRAADTIALNIAKGSIGQSNPEYRKFIGYSIRSLAEGITCLYKPRNRNYISEKGFENHYNEAKHLTS